MSMENIVMLALGLVAWVIGYYVAVWKFRRDRHQLNVARQLVQAEWATMVNNQRINDVFFAARAQMRADREDGLG